MPLLSTAVGNIYFAIHKSDNDALTPVLLIHGASVDHLSWPAELRRLPGWRVITLDLPGHGRSEPPGRTSVAAYAESIVAFMDSLVIANAVLVGHSMGSAISQTIALNYPTRVAGLVLIGTGAKLYVTPKILDNILTNPEEVADRITRWQWGESANEEMREKGRQNILSIKPEIAHGDFSACNEFNLEDKIAAIKAPTLVIGGTADKMTPFELGEQVAAKIAHTTFVRLEGAGHMMQIERGQEVADHVLQWLNAQHFIA